MMYPGRIVILVEDGYGFTLSTDAIALSRATRALFEVGAGIEICYFRMIDINAIFEAVGASGIDLVICDPPEDSACHLFN
jgi:hypothetical protein